MNNNILIGAEGIDGANFLASCLTMSDEVYFNNCTLNDKIEYFFRGISKIEEKNGIPIWSDVSMLFSSCARQKDKLSFSTYQSKLFLGNRSLVSKIRLPISWPLKNLMLNDPQNPIVKLLDSKYFIGMVNPDLFISLRLLLKDQKVIKYNDCDLDLLTVSEFNYLLSKDVQEIIKYNYKSNIEKLFDSSVVDHHKWNMCNLECSLDYVRVIKSHFNNENSNFYMDDNQLIKNKITHEWDCNWFLDENETIHNLKFLYSDMNLGKFNERLIRGMYRVWIRRIDYIKRSHIKSLNFEI